MRGVEVLIVSGRETDICVLATIFSAIDSRYCVVLAGDCLCSSFDQAHDATIVLYLDRHGSQISVISADVIVERWRSEPL